MYQVTRDVVRDGLGVCAACVCSVCMCSVCVSVCVLLRDCSENREVTFQCFEGEGFFLLFLHFFIKTFSHLGGKDFYFVLVPLIEGFPHFSLSSWLTSRCRNSEE